MWSESISNVPFYKSEYKPVYHWRTKWQFYSIQILGGFIWWEVKPDRDWSGLFWTLITEWNCWTNEIIWRMKLLDEWNYLANEIIWRMKLLGEWSRIWLKPKLAKVRTETGCQGLAHIFKGADPSFSDQLKREKTPQLWTSKLKLWKNQSIFWSAQKWSKPN